MNSIHVSARVAASAFVLFSVVAEAQDPVPNEPTPSSSVDVGPSPYHDHERLTEHLRSLAVDPRAELRSLGKSYDERDIWLLSISGPDPVPVVYVDAAHDGNDLTAAAVVTAAAEKFLALPSDSLDALLAHASFHFVPRVSPDAVERALSDEDSDGRIPRAHDDDRDGRTDEDSPSDVDGDGAITWMRVLDPAGGWTRDPGDPRVLVEREDDDDGPFYRRYVEGLDDDGDGRLNEDGVGGVNVLNNFPHAWEVPAVEPNGGPYAASERETVAILEHFVSTPEIALVVTLSQGDRPERPGIGTEPPKDDAKRALDLLDGAWEAISGRAFDVDYESPGSSVFGGAGQFFPPPKKNQPIGSAPRAVVSGSFLEWAHFQHGALAVSPRVWVDAPTPPDEVVGADVDTSAVAEPEASGDEPAGEDDDTDSPRDERTLAWIRHADDVFSPWREIDHPTLGTVEVGGLRPSALRRAPAAAVDSMATDVVEFVEAALPLLARLEIRDVEVTPLAGTLARVGATIANRGRVPTLLPRAQSARLFAPAVVDIELPTDGVLIDSPERIVLGHLGPGERRRVEWLVRLPAGGDVTVRAHSTRAGHDATTLSLSAPEPPPADDGDTDTTAPNEGDAR